MPPIWLWAVVDGPERVAERLLVGRGYLGARGYVVYNNLVADNVVLGNGTVGQGAGIGLFGPTPGTAVYNNTISGSTVVGNGTAGITFHAHTAGQNLI
jgi:hypothetical protein